VNQSKARGVHRTVLACMTATALGGGVIAAQPALAGSLCVGTGSGCYPTIQAAVGAAHNGDTIVIRPGTYRGGVSILKSVRIQGSGASSTIIRGGRHVLTIGALGATHEPVVSISGVTITGGVARSSPLSVPLFGKAGVWAMGAGVEIPPQSAPANNPPANGATVTISNSVITGNHADPATAVPSGIKCLARFPHGQCPFAMAAGGGIDSWGKLTLAHTLVSGNSVGPAAGLPPVASDSDGAGIFSAQGSLTMTDTVVSRNLARAAAPNGRFAEGGGVFVGFDGGNADALTVSNSLVIGNSARLTTDLPAFANGGKLIEMNANSGGIHVGDSVPTTVDHTALTGNSVRTTGLRGEPVGFDSAMLVGDSTLTMRDSNISGNQVSASMATTADSGPAGTTLEIDGGAHISNTSITGNRTTVESAKGVAGNGGAGLAVLNFTNDPRLVTVSGGVIGGNYATARTRAGSATVQGVGVLNNSLLDLSGVRISGNHGLATGPAGVAQGGGIWNGVLLSGPPVKLTLARTRVTRNSVAGSKGITVHGGGLFTTSPVTRSQSLIALNRPDQCFGCTGSASSPQNGKIAGAGPGRAARLDLGSLP
jgi:hypothetical protein